MLTLTLATWHALGAEYLNETAAADVRGWHALADYFDRAVSLVTYRPTVIGRTYRAPDGRLWTAVDNGEPYADLSAMTYAHTVAGSLSPRPIEVSALYCEHPVLSVDQNVRFRVWHDSHHITHSEGFSRNEELRLFGPAAAELTRTLGAAAPAAVESLFVEQVGQLAAAVLLGDFPPQRCASLGPIGREVCAELTDYALTF